MGSHDPKRPWNELPPLPPSGELEPRTVLRASLRARVALAELKQAGHLIPNQKILINTIPLLEAQASSEIENIVTTTDQLFRFAPADQQESADPATKEALRYRGALARGYELLSTRPVSTAVAVEVCRTLLGVDVDIRRIPGTALVNHATGETVYTPPEGDARLRDLLANWERWLHPDGPDEVDPLVRMAVAHYQFEAIHPFTDGNGRTGRVLNLLYLIERGLLELPVLYLSGAIIRRKPDYYRLLRGVTADAAWEPWILYMLGAVEETAQWTTTLIHRTRELLHASTELVRTEARNIYSRELVELTFVQPYCRIRNVVDAGLAKRQTAAIYLRRLADIGLLEEVEAGRERLFVNRPLMKLLLERDTSPPLQPGSSR